MNRNHFKWITIAAGSAMLVAAVLIAGPLREDLLRELAPAVEDQVALDRILITLKAGSSPDTIDSIAANLGGSTLEYFPSSRTYVVQIPPRKDLRDLMDTVLTVENTFQAVDYVFTARLMIPNRSWR